jgi:GNAT superfamily N-acetyltransferase
VNSAAQTGFALEGASRGDFEGLLALRLRAMRESLERLGLYDERRARQRLADGFDPEHTKHIVVQGRRVGFLVLKPLSHVMRLNHLYIDPPFSGRGIGHQVLEWACAEADRTQLPLELCALKGSDANHFYLRHGDGRG